jgi:hypothetical protein
LDRKVGEYSLPPNVSLIAAGNRAGDRGVTYQMPMYITTKTNSNSCTRLR